MSVFSGDFLGFQLGDIHSSQLNITRVSNGDRYTENLTPNFNDTVAQVPGGDGTYYWNTFYSQKPFTIDFAFDDLRDEDIRRLKQIFSFKGVKELIFDEISYKKYYVKCSAPPTLKYISFPFEEIKIYKGEGSVNLTAYYPYALSTREIIFDSKTEQDLINMGDIEAPTKIYYKLSDVIGSSLELTLKTNKKQTGLLKVENISKLNANDTYMCIDSRTHLIEGLDSNYKKTGTLYNRFITTGDFFLLPVDQNVLNANIAWDQIRFNYLYY